MFEQVQYRDVAFGLSKCLFSQILHSKYNRENSAPTPDRCLMPLLSGNTRTESETRPLRNQNPSL